MASDREYYILSVKWTNGDYACFWKPNDAGYTTILEEAGRYAEQEVLSHENHYNNGYSTLAIPCDKIEGMTTRVISRTHAKQLIKAGIQALPPTGDTPHGN